MAKEGKVVVMPEDVEVLKQPDMHEVEFVATDEQEKEEAKG